MIDSGPLRLCFALAFAASPLVAAEAEDGPAAVDEAAEDAEGWSARGQIGAFFTSVVARRQEASRDATISGTTETIAYILDFDGALDWREGDHAVEQTLILQFGRQREQDQAWIESSDEINYDGAYKYHLEDPHFMYGAWGADSVFTGSQPEEEFLDPFTVKVSAGYGQQYTWTEPRRKWEWRAGVRAQKTWARGLDEEGREIVTGIEFVTRYEAKPLPDLAWWIQYEAFSEFEDPGHIINLLTANLDYQLLRHVTLKLSLRAYYESEPEDVDSAVGYDEVSVRQETLIGLTYAL